jgi:hypothetical protein
MTSAVLLWVVCVVMVMLVVCGVSAALTGECWGCDDDERN